MATAKKLRGQPVSAGREATPDEFKAMAHPLRLRIIRACLHDDLTNKQIADALDQEPATTLYHVRLLVRTGFLEPVGTRTGARGATEKPYRTTSKSWVLSVKEPDRLVQQELAVIDALRDEVAAAMAADHANLIHNTRLGLRLTAYRARELDERIHAIVAEYAAEPDDEGGQRYGLMVTLHRLR